MAKMKIDIEKFSVGRGTKQQRILLLTDLHLGPFMPRDFDRRILEIITERSIDLIVIAGDITNFDDRSLVRRLKQFLRAIAKVPVFLSLGNHDVYYSKTSITRFGELSKIKNVFPLDNAKHTMRGIDIIGFLPQNTKFRHVHFGKRDVAWFVDSWRATKLTVSPKRPTLLLSHVPQHTAKVANAGELPELFGARTLVVSGHLHNGLIPLWLEKLTAGRLGDFGIQPCLSMPIVRKCRGQHRIGRATMVVSKGVRKYFWIPSIVHVTEIDWRF